MYQLHVQLLFCARYHTCLDTIHEVTQESFLELKKPTASFKGKKSLSNFTIKIPRTALNIWNELSCVTLSMFVRALVISWIATKVSYVKQGDGVEVRSGRVLADGQLNSCW